VVVPIEVDASCTLCRLISGQLERSVVYEDDQVVAFMDHLDQLDENLSHR
jgi:diadenosine tetraphosphate (Ap4A) HIT family hydrolase